MKKILMVAIAALMAGSSLAQELPAIPEPEFIGEVIVGRPHVGDYRKLPKERASRKTAADASAYLFGIGHARSKLTLPEWNSPLQLSDADSYVFIVKAENNNYDPASIIRFIYLTQEGTGNNARRTSELASVATYGTIEEDNQDYVPFSAKKYGESSYALSIRLVPGEYGIIVNARDDNNMIVATFGIFSQAERDDAIRYLQEAKEKEEAKIAEKEQKKIERRQKRGQ